MNTSTQEVRVKELADSFDLRNEITKEDGGRVSSNNENQLSIFFVWWRKGRFCGRSLVGVASQIPEDQSSGTRHSGEW